MSFGLSAAAVGLIAAGTGAAVGVYSANKSANAAKEANQAQIEAAQMDPRLQSVLYGQGGTGGLLSQYQALGQQPQAPGMKQYGEFNQAYLGTNAPADVSAIRDTAYKQMVGQTAPTAAAATVNAPPQNALDLTGSYKSFIEGAPGANPFLTGAIGKGINQSANAFGNMVTDATKATQDVLGNIRGNSVLAGQYGGSRQGLAEGKAIESMNTQLARAAQQFGQGNTDAAVAAQAAAYDADRARALAATQGLSGQQYGAASQNAAQQQQTNLANLGAQQTANSLSSANQQLGVGNLTGLLGSAYGVGTNQGNFGINQATQTNALLQPYLLKNSNIPPVQPTYANTGGAALGGATAGLGLLNMYNQLNKPQNPYGYGSYTGGSAGTDYTTYG